MDTSWVMGPLEGPLWPITAPLQREGLSPCSGVETCSSTSGARRLDLGSQRPVP